MVFFRKYAWFIRPRWLIYAIAVFFVVVSNVLTVLPPKILSDTIDGIGNGILLRNELYFYVGLLFGIAVLQYVSTHIWAGAIFGKEFEVKSLLETKLYEHLTRVSPYFTRQMTAGKLMSILNNDIAAIGGVFGFGILSFLSSYLGLLSALYMMIFFINWKLTLVSLIPLPILIIIAKRTGKSIQERWQRFNEATGKFNDQILANIAGAKVIRAFRLEQEQSDKLADTSGELTKRSIRLAFWDHLYYPVISLCMACCIIISVCYGIYLIQLQQLTVGQLIAFTLYLNMITWPALSLGNFINIFRKGLSSHDNIQEVLDQASDKTAEGKSPPPNPQIELLNVSFRYPDSDHDTLHDINITFQAGSTVAITGNTGSGKSTLIKLILGFVPFTGEMRVNGIPIDNIWLDQWRARVGYAPQEHLFLSASIRENLLLGNADASEHEINRVLRLAQLDGEIAAFPSGLDAQAGEGGSLLSGGQRQRLAIARALLVDPEILFLDHSTSSLDHETESRVMDGLLRERAGRLTIIASNRLDSIRSVNHIIVMEQGRIAAQGTHQELLENNNWYRQQYHAEVNRD